MSASKPHYRFSKSGKFSVNLKVTDVWGLSRNVSCDVTTGVGNKGSCNGAPPWPQADRPYVLHNALS